MRHALFTKIFTILLAISTFVSVCAGQTTPEKKTEKTNSQPAEYIVKDGIIQGKLYLPASTGRAVQFAAEELQGHLKKISGADLEKTAWQEKRPAGSGFVFIVRPESEWKGKELSQAFTIEEDAATCQVRITGNTELAVLYGVYQYLGDLGVRWLSPGEIGMNIPRLADIPIRPGKQNGSPSFSYRNMTYSPNSEDGNTFEGSNIDKDMYECLLYQLRNRTFLAARLVKVILKSTPGDFSFAVPPDGTDYGSISSHAVKPMTGLTSGKVKELMEKEPERFSMVTGDDFVQKRIYNGGQVCFSNEKNIQNAIENCIAYFETRDKAKSKRNTDLDELESVSMGLSDGCGICECENCAKIAGKGPNSKDRLVWCFWNRVAKGLNEKMPGRKIAVFAPYMDVTQPPDDVKIEPNIIAAACFVTRWEKAPENKESYPFPKQYLQQITKLRDAGATLAAVDYLNYAWSPTPLLVLDVAQEYAKLGYKRYFIFAMQRNEYTWPLVWSLAQFTWDSSKAPREYLKEFCREYYGAPYDQDILWFLEEATRNVAVVDRIIYGTCADNSYMFPEDVIKEGRERFNNAVGKTQGKQQERLLRFKNSVEAQFQSAEMYRAYSKALNNRTPEDIADFEKRANGLLDYWQKNNLDALSSSFRSSKKAAEYSLKTDFAGLKPSARKELMGKGPQDEIWMKELFAGLPVPKDVPNLFPLPEVWKFHMDADNTGIGKGYFKIDYDDSNGWPPLSTWEMVGRQGYKSLVISGYFWYRLTFKAPKFPAGKKVFLRIGSLDDSGDVYLNGVKVGCSPDSANWDKSFAMDVTKEIKPGAENILAIHGFNSDGGEGVWRPSALYTE